MNTTRLFRSPSPSDLPRSIARYLLPEEIAPVDVALRTYSNGLRVLSERVAGASPLALGLWVNVGSQDENARNNGIAHCIEHVVFKGTSGRTMREIMRSIESRGGYLNAFTTKEHTCFYTFTRAAHLEESVSVVFDLAMRPRFSEVDIESEKAVILEEISGLEDEPDELAFELFEREVFGAHSLGRPIAGTANSVGRFNRKMLQAFHHTHYRAHNMIVVASGPHEHETLFRAVSKAIRHLSSDRLRRSAQTGRFPRLTERERLFPRASGQQAHIILGRRAPGTHSRRHLAINALITIAGGGMSSRLNLRLREELGLAYDASAFYSPFEAAGTAGLYIATANDNHKRATAELRRIARGLTTRPISAVELDRAKEQLIGGIVLPMESVTNRMMRSAQNMLYFGGYQPIVRDVEKIARLTLEEVRAEATQLFAEEKSLLLVSVVPDGAGEQK